MVRFFHQACNCNVSYIIFFSSFFNSFVFVNVIFILFDISFIDFISRHNSVYYMYCCGLQTLIKTNNVF